MTKEVPPGNYKNIPDLIDVVKSIYGLTLDMKSTDKVKLIGLEIAYNPSTPAAAAAAAAAAACSSAPTI